MKFDIEDDEWKQVIIDLKPHLQHSNENLGQLIVLAEPVKEQWKKYHPSSYDDYDKYHEYSVSWIQSTKLCIDGFSSGSEKGDDFITWVSKLEDGSPIEGAKVSTGNGLSGFFFLYLCLYYIILFFFISFFFILFNFIYIN